MQFVDKNLLNDIESTAQIMASNLVCNPLTFEETELCIVTISFVHSMEDLHLGLIPLSGRTPDQQLQQPHAGSVLDHIQHVSMINVI